MIVVRWNIEGFPREVAAADAEEALRRSWPSRWTHPVTGERVVDHMKAREAITWIVRQGPCPNFEHDFWASNEQFLRSLFDCGAIESLTLEPELPA